MIASAKKHTKNKQTNKKRTDRTLGQMVKAKLHRLNHTKNHTHTHSQKEKKEIYIYIYLYIKKKRRRATKSVNKSTSDNKL